MHPWSSCLTTGLSQADAQVHAQEVPQAVVQSAMQSARLNYYYPCETPSAVLRKGLCIPPKPRAVSRLFTVKKVVAGALLRRGALERRSSEML